MPHAAADSRAGRVRQWLGTTPAAKVWVVCQRLPLRGPVCAPPIRRNAFQVTRGTASLRCVKVPEPLVFSWRGHQLRVRHNDPRLSPYSQQGATIRSAIELASDVGACGWR
jgi:hypothetical protein